MALNELQAQNTCVCQKSGKTFGELIQHFIVGGDETSFMACETGAVHVIGSVGNRKTEKRTVDSPQSITMYQTGSVAGDTGPTVFLLKGIHKKSGYTDEFLLEHGAKQGSTIIMTENAFMMTKAWEDMAPSICCGLRAINEYVAANPQWLMLELINGFGAHLSSYKAMVIHSENKILCLKEEADSSHVNQAYDHCKRR